MRVFLTGGTGFVGSHIAEALIAGGHEVVAMVRSTSKIEHLQRLGVTFVEGVLLEAEKLREELSQVDALVHVAGLLAAKDEKTLFRVNGEGTEDLARVFSEVKEGAPFIYISSVAAQGPSNGQCPPGLGEERPVSVYGRSKLDGEKRLGPYRKSLQIMILRPPPVYGPRDRDMYQVFQLANYRLGPVLGFGNRLVSVIHAEDLASAVLLLLERRSEVKSGSVFPIDDGRVYTWKELGEKIGLGLGKSVITLPIPKPFFAVAAAGSEFFGRLRGETPTFDRDKYREMIQLSWVCGNQGLREQFHFSPRYDLESGARQTGEWYRRKGWLR